MNKRATFPVTILVALAMVLSSAALAADVAAPDGAAARTAQP
jgi:hypothetical protein